MLYDKRWDKQEVKADPFSLESLIAWLEKNPAAKKYCYQDNGGCLLARYFLACGFSEVSVGGTGVVLDGKDLTFSEAMQDIPLGFPRTYGAALDRARAALRAEQQTLSY